MTLRVNAASFPVAGGLEIVTVVTFSNNVVMNEFPVVMSIVNTPATLVTTLCVTE